MGAPTLVTGTDGVVGLGGIACPGVDDCWAAAGTAFAHYSGSGWTLVAVPHGESPGESPGDVQSVACASASQCWAVGFTSAPFRPLMDEYTGSTWTAVTGPAVAGNSDLEGVACLASGVCWAVGSSSGNLQSLIEVTGGQGWTVVTGSDQVGQLQSVACVTASDCWAVGHSGGGGFIETDAGG